MKTKLKTLVQALIISAIVVSIYTFLVIYSLAEQTIPGAAGTAEKQFDFGNILVLESLHGIILLSLSFFCILTIIFFFVILLIKKWKKKE